MQVPAVLAFNRVCRSFSVLQARYVEVSSTSALCNHRPGNIQHRLTYIQYSLTYIQYSHHHAPLTQCYSQGQGDPSVVSLIVDHNCFPSQIEWWIHAHTAWFALQRHHRQFPFQTLLLLLKEAKMRAPILPVHQAYQATVPK